MAEFGIHMGALCDPISTQLEQQGVVVPKNIDAHDATSKAITMLLIHGLLTCTEGEKARKRLMKKLTKDICEAEKEANNG